MRLIRKEPHGELTSSPLEFLDFINFWGRAFEWANRRFDDFFGPSTREVQIRMLTDTYGGCPAFTTHFDSWQFLWQKFAPKPDLLPGSPFWGRAPSEAGHALLGHGSRSACQAWRAPSRPQASRRGSAVKGCPSGRDGASQPQPRVRECIGMLKALGFVFSPLA